MAAFHLWLNLNKRTITNARSATCYSHHNTRPPYSHPFRITSSRTQTHTRPHVRVSLQQQGLSLKTFECLFFFHSHKRTRPHAVLNRLPRRLSLRISYMHTQAYESTQCSHHSIKASIRFGYFFHAYKNVGIQTLLSLQPKATIRLDISRTHTFTNICHHN